MMNKLYSKTLSLAGFAALIALVCMQVSCTKESQIDTFDVESIRYERHVYGGYNMIWLPSEKNLTDSKYIIDFQKRIHSGQLKSN